MNLSLVFLACLLPATAHALTLGEAVDAAWARATAASASQAQRGEAEAAQRAADAWLPEPPAITFSERSDRAYRNRGEREQELALSLPLWLPGQRDARQAAAGRALGESDAAQQLARLELAGEVRHARAQLAAALAERDAAKKRQQLAMELANDAQRREAAGELARTDRLLADDERLQAESEAASAQARVAQAQAAWMRLTGLDQLPDDPERAGAAAPETHPKALAAAAAVERARAQLALEGQNRRDPPELSLGWRESRDAYGEPPARSVGISLRIPFATEARNAPVLAQANGALIRAQAEQRAVLARLVADETESAAALAAADATERLSRQRLALAHERHSLLERAWKLGELSLADWLRAQAARLAADSAAAQARLAAAAAHAQLNQARGHLP